MLGLTNSWIRKEIGELHIRICWQGYILRRPDGYLIRLLLKLEREGDLDDPKGGMEGCHQQNSRRSQRYGQGRVDGWRQPAKTADLQETEHSADDAEC